MGRKGKCFISIKKVFSPESKEKKSQTHKSKKKWGFGKSNHSNPNPSESLEDTVPETALPPPPNPISEEVKRADAENEQSKHAYSVALASAVAAEAAAVAAQAAAEVVRLTSSAKFSGGSREEAAAIKIQTAFRCYLARRALRALRGLVRLESLTNSNSVKRQTTAALRCMQTLARVQSQIRSRRLRMSEENQALHRQLQLKHERELERLRMDEEWDTSLQSKEQLEASLLNKQEGAIRRERALAYAFSHQWKSSSRSANPMFMDPNNPQWGWSWLERWMPARRWESRSVMDKDISSSDRASVKSFSRGVGVGEITKAYARRDINSERPSPRSIRQSPSTPPSVVGKVRSASPRSGWGQVEDESRSIRSMQSERPRRHSIAGSSVRDDESLASSPAVPSYMAATESARAKSRFHGPSSDKIGTVEWGAVGSVKKRLSFPAIDKNGVQSPARVRRHSGPPKVDVASLTSNGGGSR